MAYMVVVGVLVMAYMGLNDMFNKLGRRILRLEKAKLKKGDNVMSEIIRSLVGERCSLQETNGMTHDVCVVLAVDDEWIKLNIIEKNNESVVIKRIEDIEQISILSN